MKPPLIPVKGYFYTGERNKGGNKKTQLARLAAKLKSKLKAKSG